MVGHQKLKNLLLINYLLNCYINLLYYYYNLTLYFIQFIILVMYNSLLNFIYSLCLNNISHSKILQENVHRSLHEFPLHAISNIYIYN